MASALPPIGECCSTCDDLATTQIPGPQGAAGTNGTNGTDGVDSYTTTTAQFTMPAENGTVTVSVGDSTWMTVGQVLYVQNAGWMRVTAKPTTTSVTLRNIEDTATSAYTENAAPATVIGVGATISPGGLQGPANSLTGAAGGDLEGTYPNPTLAIPGAVALGDLVVNTGLAVAPRFSFHGTGGAGNNGRVLHARSTTGTGLQYSALDMTGVATILSGALTVPNGGTGVATFTANRLLIGNGASAVSTIALGAANQILGMNAGATANEYKTLTAGAGMTITHGVGSVTLASTAAMTALVRAFAAVNQGVTSPTDTPITLGSETFDADGCFAASTFTAPATGTYKLCMHVSAIAAGATAAEIRMYRNGGPGVGTIIATSPTYMSAIVVEFGWELNALIALTAGDTILFTLLPASNNVTIQGGTTKTWFDIMRVA